MLKTTGWRGRTCALNLATINGQYGAVAMTGLSARAHARKGTVTDSGDVKEATTLCGRLADGPSGRHWVSQIPVATDTSAVLPRCSPDTVSRPTSNIPRLGRRLPVVGAASWPLRLLSFD